MLAATRTRRPQTTIPLARLSFQLHEETAVPDIRQVSLNVVVSSRRNLKKQAPIKSSPSPGVRSSIAVVKVRMSAVRDRLPRHS